MDALLFKKIFDSLSNAVAYCRIILDEQNQPIDIQVIEFNQEYAKLVELDVNQDKGIRFSEIKRLRKETLRFWFELGHQATSTMKRVEDFYFSNNLHRHFHFQLEPISHDHFIMQVHDITVQMLKLTEKEIIIQSLDNIIFELNHDFVYLNVYTADESNLFIPKEHFIGKSIQDILPSELSNLLIESLKEAEKTNEIVEIEYMSPFPFDNRWYKAQLQFLVLNNDRRFIANIMDITHDKEIKDQLQHQTRELEKFFSINLDLLCIVDLNGNFIRLNRTWEKTLGYKLDDLLEQSLVDLVHPEDIDSTLAIINALNEGSDVHHFVNRYRTVHGDYRMIEWRASLGDNQLIYGAARDITAQKELEKELRFQKEQFEMAIEGSQQGIWDWDIAQETLFLSRRFKHLLGYKEHELKNEFDSFSDHVVDEDYEYVMHELSMYLEGRRANFDIEFRMKHKDNSHVWIRSRAEAIRDEKGIAIRMAGLHSDITVNKIASQKLQEAYFRLNLMAEYGRIITWEFNHEGLFTYISPMVKNLIGYSPTEIVDKMYFCELYPEKGREAFKKQLFEAFASMRKFVNVEHKLLTKPNDEIWVLTNGIPFVDANGDLIGYRGSYQDITQQKQSQKELQESEEKYRLLTENLSDVVWIYNLKTNKFSYFSGSVENLSGFSVNEILQKSISDIMSLDSFKRLRSIIDSTVESFSHNPYVVHNHRCEIEFKTKSGYYNWTELVFKYRFNDHYGIEVIGVGRDIDARKKVEVELHYLSYHDQLTGLYNRSYYETELKRLNTERNLPLSIIMSDINDLKLTNDTFGHLEGDQVIKDFANILKEACREDDIIARIGGDEFVVLLPKTSVADVVMIVDRIKQLIFETPPRKLKLSASVGYMTSSTLVNSLDELFIEAEDIMYKQKIRTRQQQFEAIVEVIEQSVKEKFPIDYDIGLTIAKLANEIAQIKKMTKRQQKDLYDAARFSKIGLLSSDKKTEQHQKIPEFGYQILKQIPEFRDVADIVLSIEERVDGSGYPQQLEATDIPLPSKIIRIVSDYCYHKQYRGLQKDQIIELMWHEVDYIYDRECFEMFIELKQLD